MQRKDSTYNTSVYLNPWSIANLWDLGAVKLQLYTNSKDLLLMYNGEPFLGSRF